MGDFSHAEHERLVVREYREGLPLKEEPLCRTARYMAKSSRLKELYLVSGLRSCLLENHRGFQVPLTCCWRTAPTAMSEVS